MNTVMFSRHVPSVDDVLIKVHNEQVLQFNTCISNCIQKSEQFLADVRQRSEHRRTEAVQQ